MAEKHDVLSNDAQKSILAHSGNKPNGFLSFVPYPGRLFKNVHIFIVVVALIGCLYGMSEGGLGGFILGIFCGIVAGISFLCLAGLVKGIRALGLLACIAGVIGGLWLGVIEDFFAIIVVIALLVYIPSGLSILRAMLCTLAKSSTASVMPEVYSSDFAGAVIDEADSRADRLTPSRKYPTILLLLVAFFIVEIVHDIPFMWRILQDLLDGEAERLFYSANFIISSFLLPLVILFYVWKRNLKAVQFFLFIRLLLSCYFSIKWICQVLWPEIIYNGFMSMLQKYYEFIGLSAYNIIAQVLLLVCITKSRQIARWFYRA